jgi:putative oxidoreductase
VPSRLLRLVLGAVFIYAAYTKLRQGWLLFALSVDSYQLLPAWAVFAVARTLPGLELALGVLLVVGIWVRYLSIAAAGILALFFVVMIVQFFGGTGIDCGCFGVGEPLSIKTLARDGVLLAAALWLVALAWRAPRLTQSPGPGAQGPGPKAQGPEPTNVIGSARSRPSSQN